jgi:hypothetical protein
VPLGIPGWIYILDMLSLHSSLCLLALCKQNDRLGISFTVAERSQYLGDTPPFGDIWTGKTALLLTRSRISHLPLVDYELIPIWHGWVAMLKIWNWADDFESRVISVSSCQFIYSMMDIW